MITLDALNACSAEEFAAALDGVFEHAPWSPSATAPHRPFATVTVLHEALMNTVCGADADTQRRFLRGHPPLSAAAISTALTADSKAEQAGLGLAGLGEAAARFAAQSNAYARAFNLPFIICARRHTPSSVLRTLERRLVSTEAAERAAALAEVHFITRLRLVARVSGPGVPKTTGHLSTHVLDTGRGRPAEGVRIELFRDGTLIREGITNRDGRTPQALIEDEPLRIGPHELRFHVGPYFAGWSPPVSDPPWYDVIPVQFFVTEPEGHYHTPLLVAPWQYTTYRGS